MSLASRLMKSTKLGGKSGVLSDVFKNKQKDYDTGIPAMNLAYSGSFDTGTTAGITVFAGKSKSFKTLFGLITCKAYMDEEPEAFMLFYNSEGGAPEQYFNQVGIDPSRVLMMDIMNIEDMQIDMVDKLEQIKAEYEAAKKGDEKPKFIVFVDSVGNLASKKEVEDAKKGHGATDMGTRAKALKAFYRIVTPYFNRLDMQMVVIGHTYDEMASMGAPKQIVSGGTGQIYSANQIFVVGKRQIKEGKDVVGWQFILNVEKSRNIREKSAIPFEVKYGVGIDKYSGLLDMAIATGHVISPKMGWYTRPNIEDDKNWRRKETSTPEFWDPMLADEEFTSMVRDMYSLDGGDPLLQQKIDSMLTEDDEVEEDIKFDKETGEILEG